MMNNIFHMYMIQRDLDKIRNYQKINYKLSYNFDINRINDFVLSYF